MEPVLQSLRTSTTEPAYPRARPPQQEKPWKQEACALQLESSPQLPKLEKGPCSNEEPSQPKIKNKVRFE